MAVVGLESVITVAIPAAATVAVALITAGARRTKVQVYGVTDALRAQVQDWRERERHTRAELTRCRKALNGRRSG